MFLRIIQQALIKDAGIEPKNRLPNRNGAIARSVTPVASLVDRGDQAEVEFSWHAAFVKYTIQGSHEHWSKNIVRAMLLAL